MRTVSASEMKDIDRDAVATLGISEIVLMENAGRGAAELIISNIPFLRSACAVCGKGNNAGDALVALRHLHNSGVSVKAFLTSPVEELSKSAKTNAIILEKLGIRIEQYISVPDGFDVIIDGLFGIGLSSSVKQPFQAIINDLNAGKKDTSGRRNYYLVSMDVPSGMDPDSGRALGACIEADMTVTFHLPKKGLIADSGQKNTGKLVVAGIGIPQDKGSHPHLQVTDRALISKLFLNKNLNINKSDNGRLLIIAGSKSMAGAAILCANAAISTGSGLVFLSVPEEIQNEVNVAVPEAVTHGTLTKEQILALRPDCIAVGPGMGTARKDFVRSVLAMNIPLVIDADGLNSISDDPMILSSRSSSTVITPHPAELSRLTKADTAHVTEDSIGSALSAAKKFNAVTVLKGANTVIAAPDGRHSINTSGNIGLATAGSGDVLTGLISSLIARGTDPYDAAVSGVYIHGRCAEISAGKKGMTGTRASDIIGEIQCAIQTL